MITVQPYQALYLQTATDLLCELNRHYLGEAAWPREEVQASLRHQLLHRDSGARLFLAIDNSKAVALASTALLFPEPKAGGQLLVKELFVLPAYQKTGLGRQMFRYLLRYAREKGCQRVDWTVDRNNEAALGFCRSLGMAPLEEKVYFRCEGELLERLGQ